MPSCSERGGVGYVSVGVVLVESRAGAEVSHAREPTRFLSELCPTVHRVFCVLRSRRDRPGQRTKLVTPTCRVCEPLRDNAEDEHQRIVGEVEQGAKLARGRVRE